MTINPLSRALKAFFHSKKKLDSKIGFRFYLLVSLFLILLSSLVYGLYSQTIKKATKNLAYSTASSPVYASRYLSFQGRLTDSSGNPINTLTQITFGLYTTDAVGVGQSLYTSALGNSQTVLPDENGIFSVVIGKTHGSEIPINVFTENPAVYLQITAGGETMSPRQPIATVAYAVNSETLQGMPPSSTGSKNTILVIDGSGNINLGETSPSIQSSSGTLGIKGQAVLLDATNSLANANIKIDPVSSTGAIQLNTTGTGATNAIFISNANLSTGNLINAQIGNENRAYNFINFQNFNPGTSTYATRFSVGASGNVYIAHNLSVGGTLSLTGTNISTGTTALMIASNGTITKRALGDLAFQNQANLGWVLKADAVGTTTIGIGSTVAILGGAGLTSTLSGSSLTLAVGSSAGITVNTDSIGVNPGAGLSFSGTQLINAGIINATNGTLTRSGSVGSYTLGLNLGSANTWTAIQAFNGGTSGASAPFTVDSNYLVTNLNADLLDGLSSTAFSSSAMSTFTNSITSMDSRNTNYVPQDRDKGLYVDFKANTTDGLSDGGTYHGVLTFRSYGSGTDLSGGEPIQLAYTENGNLWTRMGIGATTWNTWNKIWSQNNDGVGSSLDADLLDGHDSSYFMSSSNISGTQNYVSKFTSPNTLGDSLIFDNGTNIGIGTSVPGYKLQIAGDAKVDTSLSIGTSLTVTGNTAIGGTLTMTGTNIGTGTTALMIASNGTITKRVLGDLAFQNQVNSNWILKADAVGTTSIGIGSTVAILGGSGLTSTLSGSNITLSVGSSAGITVNADSIGINPGAGLSFSGTQLINAGIINTTDTTLTRSGGVGSYTLGLNLGNANTWTALQTFGNLTIGGTLTMTGTNVGVGTSALMIASNGTVTKRALGAMAFQDTAIGTTYVATNGLSLISANTFGLGGTLIQNTNIGTSSFGLSFLGLGNSQTLFLASSGNVGVGTTNPSAFLDVVGSASSTTGEVFGTRITNNFISANPGTGSWDQGLRINTVLNTSVGTTQRGMAGIVNLIQKTGTSPIYRVQGFWNRIDNTNTGAIDNAFQLFLDSPVLSGGGTITNYFGIYQDYASAKNYFAGNLGIGTSNPTRKLDVVGNGNFSTNLSVGGTLSLIGTNVGTGTTALMIASNGTVTKRALGSLAFMDSTSLGWVAKASSAQMISVGATLNFTGINGLSTASVGSSQITFGLGGTLNTNTSLNLSSFNLSFLGLGNTQSLFLASTGNIGIGFTNPGTKLDINGTLRLNNNFYLTSGTANLSNTSDILNVNKYLGSDTTPSWVSSLVVPGEFYAYFSSVLFNSKIYSIGGYNGTTLNTVKIYDLATGNVSVGTSGGTPKLESAAVQYNGKIYSWGGNSWGGGPFNIMDIYDINTDTWSTLPPGGIARLGHTATLYNGKIYYIGGVNSSWDDINSVNIFDIGTTTWSTGTSGGVARARHTSVLYNGKIYSWGGEDMVNQENNTLDIYDIASNSWSSGTAGGTARYQAASVVYNGKIYSWGGTNHLGTRFNTVDIYDIATDSWTTGVSGGNGKYGHTATLYNSKIYFWAGNMGSSNNYMDVYDLGDRQNILSLQENGQNALTFRTNSTLYTNNGRLNILGGNVGIGLTNPIDKLQVAGNILPGSNLTYDIGSSNYRWNNTWTKTLNIGSSTWSLQSPDNSRFSIFNNTSGGNETVTILNGGNVGIGTTNPQEKLDIESTSTGFYAWEAGSAAQNFYTGYELISDAGTGQIWQSGSTYTNFGGANSMNFYSPGKIAFAPNATANTLVLSGPNVGIGTTSPEAALQIAGETWAGRSTVIGDKWLIFSQNQIKGFTNNSGAYTSSNIILNPDQGNVGIGNTNPQHLLTIGNNSYVDTNGDMVGQRFLDIGNTQYGFTPANSDPSKNSMNLYASGSIKFNVNDYSTPSHIISGAASRIQNFSNGLLLAVSTTSTGNISGWDNQLFLNDSGRVGIGTTEPNRILEISGDNPYLRINNTTATNNGIEFTQSDTPKAYVGIPGADNGFVPGSIAGDLVLRSQSQKILFTADSGNTAHMAIISSGNVGIGTTNPSAQLEVANTASFDAAGDVEIGYNLNFSNDTASYIHSLSPLYIEAGDPYSAEDLVLRSRGSGDVIIGNNSILTNAGNFGIGTFNPTTKFQIYGDQNYSYGSNVLSTAAGSWGYTSVTTDAGGIALYMAGSSFISGMAAMGAGDAVLYSSTPNALNITNLNASGYIKFYTGGSAAANERMRILSSGNVGIGTTNPISTLNVDGNITQSITHGNNMKLWLPAARNGGGTGEVGLYSWVSEPGQTWTGAGVARNMYNTTSFPRVNTGLSGQMLHFTETGNIEFVTETSGGARTTPFTISPTGIRSDTTTNASLGLYTTNDVNYRAEMVASYDWSHAFALRNVYGEILGGYSGNTYMGVGYVGINNSAPPARLYVGQSNQTMAGSALSTQLLTDAGSLGGNAGNELINASFGSYMGANRVALGVHAYRNTTGANSNWNVGSPALGISFDVDNTMRVNNSTIWLKYDGNVGIGTANPGYKLEVNGRFKAALNGEGYSSQPDVRINASNELVYMTSTIKHKTNIQDFKFDKEKLMELRPVTFDWKQAWGKGNDLGLIAEEVNEVIPDLVFWRPKMTYIDEITGEVLRDSDGNPVTDPNTLEISGVAYSKLSMYLLPVVQDHDKALTALSSQLASLNITSTGQININYNVSENILSSLGYAGAKNEIESAQYQLTDSVGKLVNRLGQFSELASAKIKTGLLTATNIVSDRIVSQTSASLETKTNLISPLSSEDHTIIISADASVSGKLAADSIETKTATVSTLFADNIISKNNSITDLMSQKISSLRDELKQIVANTIATNSGEISTPDSPLLADSSSWSFDCTDTQCNLLLPSNTDLRLTNNLIIGARLTVTGDVQLGNAFITGTFTSGQIAIKDNFIETTNTALYIQPSGVGSVHILADTLVISESGNVAINGDLNLTGHLTAQTGSFNSLISKQIKTEEIIIATDSASTIIAESSFANLATSSSQLVSNATAGTAVLPVGKTEIIIQNNKLTPKSMVYLTPAGSTGNQVVYFKSKFISPDNSSSTFTIALDQPLNNDIAVNWWIIN